MRIAHTSDWHAGRIFKQVPRLAEMETVLANLGDDLEREKIELLLVSGDVFDSGAPAADAERAVFSFFKRVGRAGIQTVVIAGNHDSAARLEAWGTLTELIDVHVVARPRPARAGGCRSLTTRSGETAQIACVPFAAPRDLVSATELAESDTVSRQRYADGMRAIVDNVTQPFDARSVNLLMLHTHLVGATFSGSERQVHLGDEWAAAPQAIPARAHYAALGHIHKPQRIAGAPCPAEYAGSPLQLDFGETGEEKSWVLVDARAGQPARTEHVPYRGGTPLAKDAIALAQLEREADRLRGLGHLWVTVRLETPEPDLATRVRKLVPNAVKVTADLPRAAPGPDVPAPLPVTAAPIDLYAAYHERTYSAPPDAELRAAFEELRTQAAAGEA